MRKWLRYGLGVRDCLAAVRGHKPLVKLRDRQITEKARFRNAERIAVCETPKASGWIGWELRHWEQNEKRGGNPPLLARCLRL